MIRIPVFRTLLPALLLSVFPGSAPAQSPDGFVNTLGMNLVHIPAGDFSLEGGGGEPVKLTISEAYYLAELEVTREQFRQFRPGHAPGKPGDEPATGISWHDARAFCDWLSAREGVAYRLPTEAEWLYAATAGTEEAGSANYPRVRNLGGGVPEWCRDWYGPFPDFPETNPTGPARGLVKVVRHGRDARLGLPPGIPAGNSWEASAPGEGRVSALPAMPAGHGPPVLMAQADPEPEEEAPTVSIRRPARPGVSTQTAAVEPALEDAAVPASDSTAAGAEPAAEAPRPDNADTPESPAPAQAAEWGAPRTPRPQVGFRVVMDPSRGRHLAARRPLEPRFIAVAVPRELEGAFTSAGPPRDVPYLRKRRVHPAPTDPVLQMATGLSPSVGALTGAAALVACANGDLLAVFECRSPESGRGRLLSAARLRLGTESWEPMEPLVDLPGFDDHAPVLWNEDGRLWLFWSVEGPGFSAPFLYMFSTDNGAHWSAIQAPVLSGPEDAPRFRPAGPPTRGADGSLVLPAAGPNQATGAWIRPEAGAPWVFSEAPRPPFSETTLRGILPLDEESLFFAGAVPPDEPGFPDSVRRAGAVAALSTDNGRTWEARALPAAAAGSGSGRAAMCRGPDGLIHLLLPDAHGFDHLSLNRAWMADAPEPLEDSPALYANTAGSIEGIEQARTTWMDGKTRLEFGYGIGGDGRFLLHGRMSSFYRQGNKQWEVTYNVGRKIGREFYWAEDGSLLWVRNHRPDGSLVWTRYGPDRVPQAESEWMGGRPHGVVTRFDAAGEPAKTWRFEDGRRVDEP